MNTEEPMNTVCPGGWTICFGEHVLSMHMEAMSFLISTEDTGELMGGGWPGGAFLLRTA